MKGLNLVKLQNEFQLEIEESDTKHTPNGFVKKYDKNNAQWTFIVFFDRTIGVCLVSYFFIANRHSLCVCSNLNLRVSAMDI